MKKIIFGSFLALCVCSCATLSKTANIADGVNSDIIINPITANVDLETASAVSGESKSVYFFIFRLKGDNKFVETPDKKSFWGRREEKCRNAAVYNALDLMKYDVLVQPKYTSEIHSYLFGLIKSYKIFVDGYGAKIQNLKQIQPGETDYDTLVNRLKF